MNGKCLLTMCAVALVAACGIGCLIGTQATGAAEVNEIMFGGCAVDPPAKCNMEPVYLRKDDPYEMEDLFGGHEGDAGGDTEPSGEDPIVVPESDAKLIAQILYYEIGGGTKLAQSAVVWTILNRVDSEIPYFPDTIEEVCKQSIKSNGKEVFMFAYNPEAPVREDLYDMAVDVMTRWYREKRGEENVGRTLPVDYVYFWGNGRENFFRIEYQGNNYWDWSLPNPYDEP